MFLIHQVVTLTEERDRLALELQQATNVVPSLMNTPAETVMQLIMKRKQETSFTLT